MQLQGVEDCPDSRWWSFYDEKKDKKIKNHIEKELFKHKNIIQAIDKVVWANNGQQIQLPPLPRLKPKTTVSYLTEH